MQHIQPYHLTKGCHGIALPQSCCFSKLAIQASIYGRTLPIQASSVCMILANTGFVIYYDLYRLESSILAGLQAQLFHT